MKKTILGVLLLLSPISVGFSQTYQKPTGETMLYRGTLIVVVPTKEGLVVCADRRLHNDSKGDTDTGLKIRPFEGGVFAASGYVIWPGGITGTIDLFSATEFALAQKKDAPVAWNSAQGFPNVGVEPFKVVDTTGLLLPREIGSQINAMSPDGVSPPLNQQLIWPTQSGIDLNALSSWKLPSSLSALVVGTNRSLGGIDWSNYLNSVTPLGGPSRGDSTIELIRGLGRPSTPFDLAHAEALPLYPLGIPPSTPTSLHESLSVLTQNTPNAISILGYDPTASRISSKPEHTGVNPAALRMYSQLSDAVSHRMGIIDESPLKGLDKVYVSPVLPNNFGAIDVLVQPETTLPSNKLSLPQEWQTGLYPYVPVNRTDSLSEAVKRYSEGDSQIRTQDFLTPLHIVPNLFAIPPPGSLLDGSKKELPQDWLKNFTPSKPPLMLDFTNPGFLPRNEVRLPESKGLGKSGASTVATLANASPDSFIGDDSFDDRIRRVAEYLGSQLHFLTESNIKISEFGTMPNNQFFEVRFFYATAAGQLQGAGSNL